ncbi:hypothetical protein [Furfurilactobacillus milii]|nr:hypothetical protein [Furfurilactobacillus milii]
MKVVLIRDGFAEFTPRTAAKTRGSHEAWRREVKDFELQKA